MNRMKGKKRRKEKKRQTVKEQTIYALREDVETMIKKTETENDNTKKKLERRYLWFAYVTV